MEQPLTDEVAAGATTIMINATNFPATGAIYLEGEVLRYSTKTNTSITLVDATQVSHKGNVRAYPLYALPANISRPFTLFRNEYDDSYEIEFEDIRFGVRGSIGYSLVMDNSGNEFLLIRGMCNEDRLQLFYYLNSVDLVNNTDVSVLPDTYAFAIVSNIVAGTLLRETEESEIAQPKLIR